MAVESICISKKEKKGSEYLILVKMERNASGESMKCDESYKSN